MSTPASQAGLRAALRWRPGRLARQSSGLLGWMLVRAAAQAATVLMLARTLGSAGYGQFVACVAVASFLVPFAGLGLSHILLRNGAKDAAHLQGYLAFAMRGWLLSLVPVVATGVALAAWLLPADMPRTAAWTAIASEVVASSLAELCARREQAAHRTHAFGALNAGLPVLRLLALALLSTLGPRSAEAALWTFAAASLAYALMLAQRLPWRPRPAPVLGPEPMAAGSGLPLCLSAFALRLQGEFNKPMLAQLGYGLAGSYNVAQRATELVAMPLLALQEALWPRLYSHGDPAAALRHFGGWMLGLALLCGGLIWIGAPLLPLWLGPDFQGAADIARLLAGLPLVQALRGLVNFQVIHAGRMPLIGWACAAGAAFSVTALAWLVPTLAAPGAVLVTYGSELLMTLWMLAGMHRRRSPTA
ncbi:MAG TPA: lipopolysaccharide biosynthesis protein [Burkholderiaceae bacterium]|nr:lipopolysaccharide biosynthesis protein [Burkholderiaceae bacterium]